MSKEKTLDDLLNEYASKGLSKSEPAKKTSFLDGAKKNIQVHREVKTAARKAEQERLAKERREAAAKTERERPVQIAIPWNGFTELNIIGKLKEIQQPIEFKITTTLKGEYPITNRSKLTSWHTPLVNFLSYFDKTYGTYHTEKETHRTYKREDLYPIERTDEEYQYHGYLTISLSKREEILRKFPATKTGKKYTEINTSSLYAEIEKRVTNTLDVELKETYNKERDYYYFSFKVEPTLMEIGTKNYVCFLDLGYGKMSHEALCIITFLIYECAYDFCIKSGLCKNITTELNDFTNLKWPASTGHMEIKPKPNNNLKKF